MTFLEKLNRLLVACMLGLVTLQAGLLVLLKSMHDDAQYRLVKNQTKHDLTCGENQFSEAHYWPVEEDLASTPVPCPSGDCEYSTMVWKRPDQKTELHIVSIQTPPPFRWSNEVEEGETQGGVVKLKVRETENPQILALVAKGSMEWDLEIDANAKIEKVIVAAPVTVFLKGLPPSIPIEYIPREKMCSYPISWEEAYNPENDFRTLLQSLRTIAGVKEVSFQGAKVGRQFTVPSPAQGRGLASVQASESVGASPKYQSPLQWKREDGKVVPALTPILEKNAVNEIPQKTSWVTTTKSGMTFAVVKGSLHLWSAEKQKFTRVWVPMMYPEAGTITALTYDPKTDRMWIYNNERSGELFAYQVENSQWSLAHSGLSRNIIALSVLDDGNLAAAIRKGNYVAELAVYSEQGKLQELKSIDKKIAVDVLRWQWEMVSAEDHAKNKHLWLRMVSTANLEGDWHLIQ